MLFCIATIPVQAYSNDTTLSLIEMSKCLAGIEFLRTCLGQNYGHKEYFDHFRSNAHSRYAIQAKNFGIAHTKLNSLLVNNPHLDKYGTASSIEWLILFSLISMLWKVTVICLPQNFSWHEYCVFCYCNQERVFNNAAWKRIETGYPKPWRVKLEVWRKGIPLLESLNFAC